MKPRMTKRELLLRMREVRQDPELADLNPTPEEMRALGTFQEAYDLLATIEDELGKTEFNILTGMQKVVTASDFFKLVLEAVQTLTAEVQRQNAIFELLAQSRWIGLSNEYGVMDKGLKDLGLKNNTK